MRIRLYQVVVMAAILLIIVNCKDVKEGELKKETVYSYADGSGNLYIVEGGESFTLEYDPVKPEESSSGFYDGGDHIKGEISREEYNQIAALFKRAFTERESHIENRVMLSGIFYIKEESGEESCIHAPDSKLKAEVEQFLKVLVDRL